MSIFDHKRLKTDQFVIDVDGLRRGIYSDRYFANIVQIFSALEKEGYQYNGANPRKINGGIGLPIGDVVVEAQIFNRRSPMALIAGVDVALSQLHHATGYFDDNYQFVSTWQDLEVVAVQDGVVTFYDGDPENVLTVIEIRGRYRDFAMLETSILGVLSRASRIATNVYEVLEASNGKPILFFPARFDVPEVQSMDGYAYWLAVRRYNQEYNQNMIPIVSTDAQAAWWEGKGSGTVPHALIACFLADDVEAMIQFARHIPIETPRILLADFNNDTIQSASATLKAYWEHYKHAYEASDTTEQKRWTLYGIRLDTSGTLRDASLGQGAPRGVNPLLVFTVREALNRAWESWDVPSHLEDVARDYCRNVQIIVSGGFNKDKVAVFEKEGVPVDSYGVGSTFLANDKRTNTDFTMDIVRLQINGQWQTMAKVGRRPCDNPDLELVDLGDI